MDNMLFHNWYALWRILVVGILSFVVLTAVIRISGKRTISKMSAFDLVITVALGSTLSTVVVSKDVALAEGVVAFSVLCALQFITSWLFIKLPWLENKVKANPSLLVYRRNFQHHVMRKVQVTEAEIFGALRSHGVTWEQAEAVILEIDGTLAVIPRAEPAEVKKLLRDVKPEVVDDAVSS